jgi:hypothetical protein
MSEKENPQSWLVIISHFIVPGIFGYLAYLELCASITVRWETIAIFSLLVSPFLLLLASQYIKKVKWGDKEFETQSTSSTKEYVENLEMKTKDPAPQAAITPTLSLMSYNAVSKTGKKILRTLWHYQKQHFGADNEKRWGFTTRGQGVEAKDFEFGAFTLLQQNAIIQDQQGMVFMTESGIEFCKKQTSFVESGDIFTKFDN